MALTGIPKHVIVSVLQRCFRPEPLAASLGSPQMTAVMPLKGIWA